MTETSPAPVDNLVTVVLPVFNALTSHPEYLRLSIQSVLGQTHDNLQLIIVDDGSTDDYTALREQTNDQRITWLRQNNAGQSAARNLGARSGTGEYLAFIDQDDCWYPTWIETALAEVQGGSFAYCDVDRMDASDFVTNKAFFATTGRGTHPKQRLEDVIGRDCWAMPSAMFMNRARFLALGGFNETLAGCEDDDLCRRFFHIGECRFIATPLVRWRQTDTSASHSLRMDESRLRYFEILRAAYPGGMLREHVAPRFLQLFSGIYRQAAAAQNYQRLAIARRELEAVHPYLRPHLQAGLACFLAMPVAFFSLWQNVALNSRLYDWSMRTLGRR